MRLCFQNTEKIFTSSQTLHSLLFINTSVEAQVALLEESRTTAKKFKGKVMALCLHVRLDEDRLRHKTRTSVVSHVFR